MVRDKNAIEYSTAKEAELAEFIGQFYDDPYGFVMACYPWGQETKLDGTPNPLWRWKGPEPWQRELLEELGDHIKMNMAFDDLDMDMRPWKSATASGHGVGKSALVSWLIQFFMSTRVDTRGVVTASTQFQLEDKTWPELGKWHQLLLNKHWFSWESTAFSFAPYPEDRRKNYRMKAATVSEQNTEAFAGLHNEGKSVVVIFDEASGVVNKVWEVAEGALTDGEAFFFAFGNPTLPEGEFADCFGKHHNLYRTRHVDSRDVSHTNKVAIQGIIDKYGEDSDEVKVRVKGEFPLASYNGFILSDGIQLAQEREDAYDAGAGLIMAVDVARFGTDLSSIYFRQGRDGRTFPFLTFKGLRTTELTEIVVKEYMMKRPDVVVIEGTGVGAGVIDQCRDRGVPVHEVSPGAKAYEHDHFLTRRAEMWVKMRDWIYDEGVLPHNDELREELLAIRYSYDKSGQRIRLESKEEMKKRGLPSPDRADSLALTFAINVPRRDRNARYQAERRTAKMQDDPLGEL